MKRITRQTIRSMASHKVKGLYKTGPTNPVFCPHVNALINIGLVELGLARQAQLNVWSLFKSGLHDWRYHLFYREINEKGELTNSSLNACKNALVALTLYATGEIERSNLVVDAIFNSPLLDKEKGLLIREFGPSGRYINRLLITQTNLWAVIALWKLQRQEQAKQLFCNLVELSFDATFGLFSSQDCSVEVCLKREFLSDDQALAVIAYCLMGQREEAETLMATMIANGFFNPCTGLFARSLSSQGSVSPASTTYKNGLCGIALGMLQQEEHLAMLQQGLRQHLYDQEAELFNLSVVDKAAMLDNSILALLALEFNELRHVVF